MIFVMPGSSKVGRLTVQHLIARGADPAEVVAGARSPDQLADLGVTAGKADYDDPATLRTAFRGVKTLILIPTTTPPAARCVEHDNALAAAKAAGVERVLFLSILTAEPTSISAIAPFILFAENATRNAGMDWALLRMGLYMEPVADWVPELIEMGRLPYPVRKGRAAYVTREDVARSLAAAALDPTRTGEIYTITSPAAVTMPELAAAISAACGRDIPFEACSDEAFVEICLSGNESPFITKVLISLYNAIEAGEFDAPPSDVERLTGQPADSVEAFFRRVVASPAGLTAAPPKA